MSDLPRPSRRLPRGRAEWNLRGAINTVNRLGDRGPVELVGHDRLGNPVRIVMPLYEAARTAAAITAAAQPKETPNA